MSSPIGVEALPPGLRRHVEPSAPAALRMMAARMLVPASPRDALVLLHLLASDEEASIREQAQQSAANLPDKIALTGLRDDGVPREVLGWIAGFLQGREDHQELLALNQAAPDDALAEIASRCSAKVAEQLAQNQIRLLRSEAFLRGLLSNPQLAPSVRDATADFAVRSGILWDDVPALVEARKRIHGDTIPPQGETAASLLQELSSELAQDRDDDDELEEERKLTLTQRILGMSVAEKIKLASLGNKEARGLLLRDTNKLVSLAAVESPRITESEIIALTQSRTAHEEVIRAISSNREWLKLYPVKVNLAKNPKTPMATALRLVPHLRERELREIQSSRNVPHVVQTAARGLLMKKRGR